MGNFRIKELSIRKFNSNRYLGISNVKVDKHILVYGEHKSGKSTTLDAIAYSIFGFNGSLRPINNIADTHIILSNDEFELIIDRKAGSNHKLVVKNLIDNTSEIFNDNDVINQKLSALFNYPDSDCLELRAKLLYQNQVYSLKTLDNKKLLRILSFYTNQAEKNKQIITLEKDVKDKIENKEYFEIELKGLNGELKEAQDIVNSSKNHISYLKELVVSYDEGSIKAIFDIKRTRTEIWDKIRKLQARNTDLQQEKDKKYLQKNDLQKYSNERTVNVVKEIISVLNCPVCGKRANLSKIENKFNLKKCPYCGDDNYDNELYSNIIKRVQESGKQLPEINKEINKIEDELSNNSQMIKELETQLNEVENSRLVLNPKIVRSVDEYSSVDDLKLKQNIEKQRMDLDKIQKDQDNEQKRINDVTCLIGAKKKEIEKIKQEIGNLEKQKGLLQKEIDEESLKAFLKKLNHYYSRLMGYKSQPVYYEEGKLVFKTGTVGHQEIDDISESTIGESEKRCLDSSILLALDDLDNENKVSKTNFVILDDPADNLYDNMDIPPEAHARTNLLNLIKEKCDTDETQFIILTADRTYNDILKLPLVKLKFNAELARYNI